MEGDDLDLLGHPGSDDKRRSGSLAEAGRSYTREPPDDVVLTSRFVGLPDSDDGKWVRPVRYDVVHCINSIGTSYTGFYEDDLNEIYDYDHGGSQNYDPAMRLGVGRDLSPGTLRDALVRCGARLLILQSLGDRHIREPVERLAEYVAGTGGPAVLVVADGRSEQGLFQKGAAGGRHGVNAYLRGVYRRILRNQPIEEAAAAAAGRPETLFAYGTGGDRLLRFDSMMEPLEQQLRDYRELVDELLHKLLYVYGELGGLDARDVDDLRSLQKLQPSIRAVLAGLARARTSMGAHAADGAILLAAVRAEVSRIMAEIGHHRGEGFLHTKFDTLYFLSPREMLRIRF